MKTCTFFQFLLSASLDKEGEPGWLVKGHLANCPACQRVWRVQSEMDGRLRSLGRTIRLHSGNPPHQPTPPVQAVNSRVRMRPSLLFVRPMRAFTILATVAVLVVVGIQLLEGPKSAISRDQLPVLNEMKSQFAVLATGLSQANLDDPLERELAGLITTANVAADYFGTKIKKVTGVKSNPTPRPKKADSTV